MQSHPHSFGEFLDLMGEGNLRAHLKGLSVKNCPSQAVHDRLLEFVRLYTAVGGMPSAIETYRKTRSLLDVQKTQDHLLATYRADFGRHIRQTRHRLLQQLVERVPRFLGQWIRYVKLDAERQPRDVRRAIEILVQAGLLHLVRASNGESGELQATANHKKFKLLFLDVGLAHRAAQMDPRELLLEESLSINRTALFKQFAGQELLAYTADSACPCLYSWAREQPGSTAEVDFVMALGGRVIPVEVRRGAIGRLKSLRLFMEEKGSPLGVRISSHPLELEGGILSVPFYMIGELGRLVDEAV